MTHDPKKIFKIVHFSVFSSSLGSNWELGTARVEDVILTVILDILDHCLIPSMGAVFSWVGSWLKLVSLACAEEHPTQDRNDGKLQPLVTSKRLNVKHQFDIFLRLNSVQ